MGKVGYESTLTKEQILYNISHKLDDYLGKELDLSDKAEICEYIDNLLVTHE